MDTELLVDSNATADARNWRDLTRTVRAIRVKFTTGYKPEHDNDYRRIRAPPECLRAAHNGGQVVEVIRCLIHKAPSHPLRANSLPLAEICSLSERDAPDIFILAIHMTPQYTRNAIVSSAKVSSHLLLPNLFCNMKGSILARRYRVPHYPRDFSLSTFNAANIIYVIYYIILYTYSIFPNIYRFVFSFSFFFLVKIVLIDFVISSNNYVK